MFTHTTQIRVRYGETDQMGYLYYGNYGQYYEVGRVEMMRSLGITYSDMETIHQVMMPVMSLSIQYLRPAYYDNLLTIYTTVKVFPTDIMDFEVEIKNEANKIINTAQVRLCFVDISSKKRVAVPDFLKNPLLSKF